MSRIALCKSAKRTEPAPGPGQKRAVDYERESGSRLTPVDAGPDAAALRRRHPQSNRVLVLHEDSVTLGWGAEVAARIASKCFEHLDAPVMRLGAKDSFVASAVSLEEEVLPSVDDLRVQVTKLLEY